MDAETLQRFGVTFFAQKPLGTVAANAAQKPQKKPRDCEAEENVSPELMPGETRG